MNYKLLIITVFTLFQYTTFCAEAAIQEEKETTYTRCEKTKCLMASKEYLQSTHPLLKQYPVGNLFLSPAQEVIRKKYVNHPITNKETLHTVSPVVGCIFHRDLNHPNFPVLIETRCDVSLIAVISHIKAIGIIATHPFFKETEKVSVLESFLSDLYETNDKIGFYTSLQLPSAQDTYTNQYPKILRNIQKTRTFQITYLDELAKAGALSEPDVTKLKLIINQGRDAQGNLLDEVKNKINPK